MLPLLYWSISLMPQLSLAQAEAEIEEIVVTGIREALGRAADQKRNDARIIDAVVSDDIGKLPDNNVAEALQRITGVSINREFGVGSEVSIRGLSQNRVELNGRSTLGDGRNGVDFQDFPTSFLSAVEVIKTPQASMIEGALGGTINLKTLRPLDLQKRIISTSGKLEYTDNTENTGPIMSFTYGDNWDLGSGGFLGLITTVSWQDRELRLDEYRNGIDPLLIDVDGDGQEDFGQHILRPDDYSYLPAIEERERFGLNLSMQWAPVSGQGNFYVEAAFTDRSGSDQTFSPIAFNNSPFHTVENRAGNPADRDPVQSEIDAGYEVDSRSTLTDTYDSDLRFINRTESTFRNTDQMSAAIGGEWDFTSNFTLSGEISLAKSESFIPFNDLRLYGVDQEAEEANPSANNFLTSGATFRTDHSGLPTVILEDRNLLTDPSNFVFRRFDQREGSIDNDETAIRTDISYTEPFGLGFVPSIEAGVRLTDRSFRQERNRLFVTGLENRLQDMDGNPIVINFADFPADSINLYNFSNAFDGEGARFDLTRFAAFDAKMLQNAGATRQLVANLLRNTSHAISGNRSDLVFEPDRFSAIDEETQAAYFQANIETALGSLPLNGVVGVRYVRSKVTAGAFQEVGGEFERTRDNNTYSDWLPSANFTLTILEGFQLRAAAGKVMRRPDFGVLSPSVNADNDNVFATRGNPQLDPFRATQYDLSVEYYWGEANLGSVAFFHKDVDSFFTSTEICLDAPDFVVISNPSRRNELCFLNGSQEDPSLGVDGVGATPLDQLGIPTRIDTNGEEGTVTGIELGYQQVFSFLPGFWGGFGLGANYTYADSEDPDGQPLEDISENTLNFQVFYEKYGFGMRLAYTYRDRFLDATNQSRIRNVGAGFATNQSSTEDITRGDSYREDIDQWDFSAFYDINKQFRIQLDVVNITDEATFDTAINGALYQIRQADRRFALGVRATF